AWSVAGTIDARAAQGGTARAAVASALAGWLRVIAAAFGAASGGQAPLAFDSSFWMLPPTTGLVMTSYRRTHNRGPYA
ncbi:MAG: hypothetical protein ACREEU_10895, partial [Acetobacteraceae bacterium]